MYKIFTRSRSEQLYSMMSEFLPKDKLIRVSGFDGTEGSIEYLHYILNYPDVDWVVNIDEDCFVYNPDMIEKIIYGMKACGYDYAGMSDGGMCPHRCHSWLVHNPFFNVFNAKKIRERLHMFTKDEVNNFSYLPIMDILKPYLNSSHFNHNNTEPFCGLFYWMAAQGFKPMFFHSYQLGDSEKNISTILVHDINFAVHTWYSRDYEIDEFHRDRINKVFEYAKSLTLN